MLPFRQRLTSAQRAAGCEKALARSPVYGPTIVERGDAVARRGAPASGAETAFPGDGGLCSESSSEDVSNTSELIREADAIAGPFQRNPSDP